MTLRVTVDGVPLDDPQGRWYASDKTGETNAPALDLAAINRISGIGEIDAPSPGYGAAEWPLVVSYEGRTYDEAKFYQSVLEATLLNRHRDVEIVKDSASWRRMTWGKVAAGTEVERLDAGQYIDVAYTIRIPSGRWFDTVVASVTVGAGLRLSGTDADGVYRLMPLLGGSRDMDATIITSGNGSATDVKVTDVESGQWVRIAGNITPGHAIIIDPVAMTATANGVAVDGLLDFSPRDFYLSPKATVRVQRGGTQPVTIRARKAFA